MTFLHIINLFYKQRDVKNPQFGETIYEKISQRSGNVLNFLSNSLK
jgi:hypothetical protein